MPISKVFIDRGHGLNNTEPKKHDPGATAGNLTEHGIVAGVAEKLKAALPAVILTPELSIQGVVQYVNEKSKPGDVLLVLHMNAGPAKATGVEVVYASNGPKTRAFQAYEIADFLAQRLGLKCRGAKADIDTPAGKKKKNGNAGLPILRDTDRPAFLIELGFVTNPKDAKAVIDKAPDALADLILNVGDILN